MTWTDHNLMMVWVRQNGESSLINSVIRCTSLLTDDVDVCVCPYTCREKAVPRGLSRLVQAGIRTVNLMHSMPTHSTIAPRAHAKNSGRASLYTHDMYVCVCAYRSREEALPRGLLRLRGRLVQVCLRCVRGLQGDRDLLNLTSLES